MDTVKVIGYEDTQTDTVEKTETQPSNTIVLHTVKKKQRRHRSTKAVKKTEAPPEGEQEEQVMDCPEGRCFKALPEETTLYTHAREPPPYNKLPENEKQYALFIDGTCRIVGEHWKWKAAVWSPTSKVTTTMEGVGESSQFAEVKAIQLALDIAEREKWPVLYLYTDSERVANGLWGWLQQQKLTNWQGRSKPTWDAALWQDIAARLENLNVKVGYVETPVPKSRDTEGRGKKEEEQVDEDAVNYLSKIDLGWDLKGEMLVAQWAHNSWGHMGRESMYRWARARGVDLSSEAIEEVIRQCEICAARKGMKLRPSGEKWLGKNVWVAPPSGKGKPVRGVPFAQGVDCDWLVMLKDGEVRGVSEEDLSLEENNP
ncbi:uncharacterized protein [Heliangelus exortis]|uniref:uncharacterized protein n=1 Tax=Heliangelus exortis TaxID=472823 RepID=UPI003A917A3E